MTAAMTTRRTLTLRGIATADAVRMFGRGVPLIVKPLAPGAEIPPGWLPVLMATPMPKHKSPSTNRRNAERRREWLARPQASPSTAGD